MKEKKKKKHPILTALIFIILLAVAGCSGYYYVERQKPVKATKDFLKAVKELDFATMESMLQTEDLSVLDNTFVHDEELKDFFLSMNEKMNYEITKVHFDLFNGTANVTARIQSADGSEIFREAIKDLAKELAAASYTDKQLSEEDILKSFSSALLAHKGEATDNMLITEITYPLVQIDNTWKIVFLDEDTIKVMSANFNSTKSGELDAAAEGINMESTPSPMDVIDMETDKFKIHYTQCRTAKDVSGKACLLVYYEYTNLASSKSSPMIDVTLRASQNGTNLDAAIPETTEVALDMFTREVSPLETVTVCQAFSLTDNSDVTITASQAFSFGDGPQTAQIIKVQ